MKWNENETRTKRNARRNGAGRSPVAAGPTRKPRGNRWGPADATRTSRRRPRRGRGYKYLYGPRWHVAVAATGGKRACRTHARRVSSFPPRLGWVRLTAPVCSVPSPNAWRSEACVSCCVGALPISAFPLRPTFPTAGARKRDPPTEIRRRVGSAEITSSVRPLWTKKGV